MTLILLERKSIRLSALGYVKNCLTLTRNGRWLCLFASLQFLDIFMNNRDGKEIQSTKSVLKK